MPINLFSIVRISPLRFACCSWDSSYLPDSMTKLYSAIVPLALSCTSSEISGSPLSINVPADCDTMEIAFSGVKAAEKGLK